MKKQLAILLIFALLLPLAVGLFACEEGKSSPTLSTEALAAQCVEAALPENEEKETVAGELLSLFEEAGLTQAEIRASLLSLKEAENLAPALLALHQKNYISKDTASYRSALQAVANAVSPEIAGAVFYACAKQVNDDPRYTLSDCRKIASLLFGGEGAFSLNFSEGFLSEELSSAGEKQLNTAILSFASSLRATVGISEGAKDVLRFLLDKAMEGTFDSSETDPTIASTLDRSRTLLTSLAELLLTNYDTMVTYAADYLSLSGARLFLGLPYEKQEVLLHYGYHYEDWNATLLTNEEYLAVQEGDYDEVFSIRRIVKGFTVNGTFRTVSEEDAELADLVYRLYAAYRAYTGLSSFEQINFEKALDDFLKILSEEEELLGSFFEKSGSTHTAISFAEMKDALSTLSDFDATDGVEEKERSDARAAIDKVKDYLHGYLPNVF